MDIAEMFRFLIEDYNLKYKYQEFRNCYNGNWIIETYSYYNDTGCFTIHHLMQRGEIDCYYSPTISEIREELTIKRLDIRTIGVEIWKKMEKKCGLITDLN